MANEMETFAARLATFDLILHPSRRSSNSKSPKPISWPHSRPSPAELAHAGFFYNPYETNPDNTTCFLCLNALDGWEEDDNPITEHLKHAKACGWAVMMNIQQHSSNPAEIEDPTNEAIAQARQSTFGGSWPHDGKKGWLCQSDKMVEGGWYFCPNEESADLASCAYCKLSLDGWEPKDNPFDEHYRRSSDCSFFVFAKPAKGKSSRAKKGRTSKASSRLSTQSTVSEIPASDVEDQMDLSVLSQPAKAKSTKKSSKSKLKSSKSKKDEVQETISQMDVDEMEDAQPATSNSNRSTRGKKRSSAVLYQDNTSIAGEDSAVQPEPPAKKRATKSRASRARTQSVGSIDISLEAPDYESEAPQEEDHKSSRGTSKKKTSRGRKGSVASSTSKATSKSRAPRNSELEAAIEAGLETDEPQHVETEEIEVAKPSSKKTKSKKKAAKKDPEPAEDVSQQLDNEEAPQVPEPDAEPDAEHEVQYDDVAAEQKQCKSTERKSKRRSSKNTNDQPEAKETDTERLPPQAQDGDADKEHHHGSFVSVEIISKPPAHYTNIELIDKDNKKAKKKTSSDKSKKSKKADKAENAEKTGRAEKPEEVEQARTTEEKPEKRPSGTTAPPEKQVPPVSPADTPETKAQEQLQEKSSHRRSSRVPPKTAERYSDISQDKHYAQLPLESERSPEDTRRFDRHSEADVSPLPSPSRGSPSLSPQSSDAENHPPSRKHSAHRAQLSSPSKKIVRMPLATSTPSPSNRNASAGRLQTSHPWVPVEIEQILLPSASDKENANLHGGLSSVKGELATPAKKMTVDEWIMWNAKNGEERLKRECERLVGQFEKEGARAMRALEGIECID
ncbi:hypothetical protein BJX99DRAFT_228801 [Aspergillus californicus]